MKIEVVAGSVYMLQFGVDEMPFRQLPETFGGRARAGRASRRQAPEGLLRRRPQMESEVAHYCSGNEIC